MVLGNSMRAAVGHDRLQTCGWIDVSATLVLSMRGAQQSSCESSTPNTTPNIPFLVRMRVRGWRPTLRTLSVRRRRRRRLHRDTCFRDGLVGVFWGC